MMRHDTLSRPLTEDQFQKEMRKKRERVRNKRAVPQMDEQLKQAETRLKNAQAERLELENARLKAENKKFCTVESPNREACLHCPAFDYDRLMSDPRFEGRPG